MDLALVAYPLFCCSIEIAKGLLNVLLSVEQQCGPLARWRGESAAGSTQRRSPRLTAIGTGSLLVLGLFAIIKLLMSV